MTEVDLQPLFAHFPLAGRVLYICEVGSTAYGLRLEGQGDTDLFVVVQPPPAFALGVDHWEECQVQREGLDVKFYSLQKYARLLEKGNPNVLETLWVADEYASIESQLFRPWLQERERFNTLRAVSALTGYAVSQHSSAQKSDPLDGKMASHALRALYMGLDFLRDGQLRVNREQNATLLKAIKKGAFPRGFVGKVFETFFQDFKAAKEECAWPETVERKWLNALLVATTIGAWNNMGDL